MRGATKLLVVIALVCTPLSSIWGPQRDPSGTVACLALSFEKGGAGDSPSWLVRDGCFQHREEAAEHQEATRRPILR